VEIFPQSNVVKAKAKRLEQLNFNFILTAILLCMAY